MKIFTIIKEEARAILAKLSLDQVLMRAKSHVKKGEVAEAQKLYQSVLQAFSKNKTAQQGLAALNKPKQNIASQSPPQEAVDQLVNLYNQGQLSAVVEQAQTLTEQYPEAFIVWNILGGSSAQIGMLDEAIEAYNKCISLKPDYAEAYSNMGVALKDQGKLDEAIEAFNNALLLKPDYAEAYSNMGATLQDQGKLDEAIEAYNKCIALKPDYADAYYNMGVALKDQGKLDQAITAYNKALSLKPDYAEAYGNMANALKDQGKLDEAITGYNKALSLKPDYAEAYTNMGVTLQDQGKLDEAIEACYKSISLKPDYADAHQNLSFTLLNSGRLKEGLDEYEWRWKTFKFLTQQRHFSQPLWDGTQSLNGKRILLWCEQGIGDTLNWSSCLSLVTAQAEHCILECPEKLVPLLERSFPNVEVKPENKSLDAERDDFDFHLPMGSLYKHFIQEITKNAIADAYLVPDPVRVNFWRKRLNSLGKGPYIGISWKSANMDMKRLPNYAKISELYPVLKLSNITYVNLQYTDFANDLTKIKKELGVTIHNFDDLDHFNNIDDVAALCAALDMVVSTKTTVPLISAGVGTLTKLANWRQSPWNNILFNPIGSLLDIFERDTWEPWDNVFSSIAEDIFTTTKSWSS
ncbi:tetratricopeptide repeat protein [bacterium]|nr:tetratricopeptide repeat protein [bacterium]